MMIGMNLSMASNPSQVTVIQQAIAVLRKFGSDAHVYLPGVGMLNGLQAANYIDSAGTQVGAVDQPVGLALDAAGGLGVELVTNGDFSNGLTGWTAGNGGSFGVSNGELTVTQGTGGGYGQANQTVSTVVGKTYTFSFSVTGGTSVASYLVNIDGRTAASSGAGSKTFTFVATATLSIIALAHSAGALNATIIFDNISVREVTGIHSSQPTTASKPILRRGAVNLLTYSGDFTNANWPRLATTATTGQTDPFGGTSATSLVESATYNVHRASQNYTLTASAHTLAAIVKRGAGTRNMGLKVWDGTTDRGTSFNTATAAVTGTITGTTAPTASSIVDIGAGYCLCVINLTTAAGAGDVGIHLMDGLTVSYAGDAASSLVIYRAALFQGTLTAAQIQALGGIPTTTTAPASTALGPYFWQFDGSNDSLSLGGPLFQMADDHCVVAGVNCQASSSWRTIFSQGGVSAVPRIQMVIDAGDGKAIGYWRDDVGANVNLFGATDLRNKTSVVCMSKVGINRSLRVNASALASSATTLGATTLSNYAIGALNGTDWMTGAIYPVIAIKGTVPDADLLLLEKLVGQMSGVSL